VARLIKIKGLRNWHINISRFYTVDFIMFHLCSSVVIILKVNQILNLGKGKKGPSANERSC
jgi:hypothetical protein